MLTIKPKTRKEIYMAYLSGDMSLELPEPLTRDEVNLYNLCKNRAYGEYTTEKEVLAECQPEFVADQGVFALTDDLTLSDGETYIVVWNGVEYKSVAHVQMIDGVAAAMLGELSAMDGPAGNGEPFGIAYIPSAYGELGWTGVIAPFDGSTTLTISIRQEVTEVKKISGKYVEGMGYVEKSVKEVLAECQPPMTSPDDGTFGLVTDVPFVAGETYLINWNGVEYPCVAQDISAIMPGAIGLGNLFAVGGSSNGEPFNIAVMSGQMAMNALDGSTTLTISIRQEVATIHPIDQKFIVLVSPNGTKYNLTVADDGTLSAVAAT